VRMKARARGMRREQCAHAARGRSYGGGPPVGGIGERDRAEGALDDGNGTPAFRDPYRQVRIHQVGRGAARARAPPAQSAQVAAYGRGHLALDCGCERVQIQTAPRGFPARAGTVAVRWLRLGPLEG